MFATQKGQPSISRYLKSTFILLRPVGQDWPRISSFGHRSWCIWGSRRAFYTSPSHHLVVLVIHQTTRTFPTSWNGSQHDNSSETCWGNLMYLDLTCDLLFASTVPKSCRSSWLVLWSLQLESTTTKLGLRCAKVKLAALALNGIHAGICRGWMDSG